MSKPARTDPFAALGLPAQAGLTDADIQAAWRRIAAATHPDRADGGDPGRFAQAAAAYHLLRTTTGRGEALADLTGPATAAGTAGQAGTAAGAAGLAALGSRIRRGRPARLVLRAAGVAAAGAGVIGVAGTRPSAVGVLAGLLTWLVLTARQDLAPPAQRG
jgi:curved DNA-binding protein CbpA